MQMQMGVEMQMQMEMEMCDEEGGYADGSEDAGENAIYLRPRRQQHGEWYILLPVSHPMAGPVAERTDVEA